MVCFAFIAHGIDYVRKSGVYKCAGYWKGLAIAISMHTHELEPVNSHCEGPVRSGMET